MKNSTKKASVSAVKSKATVKKTKLSKSAIEKRKQIAEKIINQVGSERKFVAELIKANSNIITTEAKLDELFSSYVMPYFWNPSDFESKADCSRKAKGGNAKAKEYLRAYNRIAKIKQDWKDIKFPNRERLHSGSATQDGQAKKSSITAVDRLIGNVQKARQEMLDMRAKKSALSISDYEAIKEQIKSLEKDYSAFKKYASDKLQIS